MEPKILPLFSSEMGSVVSAVWRIPGSLLQIRALSTDEFQPLAIQDAYIVPQEMPEGDVVAGV